MAKSDADRYWLGFDLGGTKMQATLLSPSFKPLVRRRRRTKGHEGAKAGLARIIATIHQAMEEGNIAPGQIGGIGVGCPGPLDLDRGILLDTPNLGWKNVPIKDALEKEFSCPAAVLNDVDAGVYGEYRFGAGKGTRCLVGIFPGTGIGGGCVYEGKILRGRTGSCMEIGHMQVVAGGVLCGCGRRGCLEAEAGRLAIAAEASMAAYRGDAPHLFSIVGTDLTSIRSGTLAESIAAGDTVIEKIVRKAAEHIGTAVANVVNLLAPDKVVLGGGLVEAMPELFLKTVETTARKRVLPAFAQLFEVAPAKLGDDAGSMGAAAWIADFANGDTRGRRAVDQG